MNELKIPCLVYSRVTGYVRPTSSYNEGKKQEFKERKMYDKSI
jgi:ribonucleoside-triphosphate reductase (formate)